MFGEDISIFARKASVPSLCFPAAISSKRAKFSSGEVSLKGLLEPACVGVPF